MKFSERYGYKPVKESIQIESMDEALRNGLWSLLKLFCWDRVRKTSELYRTGYFLNEHGNEETKLLCQRLWLNYFTKPLDELSNDWTVVLTILRRYFFDCEWYEVYDFVGFVGNNYGWPKFREDFMELCNNLLEKEKSAYRFVNGVITRISEEHEVAEIEEAIESSGGPVNKHLRRSLELLSDRKNPDYRNSIKESISAVESLVAITIKAEKGTLGQLIKRLEDEIDLHPALRAAFSSLYGYTSDEGGIRHALTEAEKVDFNDAKFMLVVCSAFINFVRGKLKSEG